MSWKGKLLDLREGRCLFVSSETVKEGKILLFAAGLGDGFFTVPYTHYLPQLLSSIDIAFAQVIIRSSYNNFGRFTLQDEADDLKAAIDFIMRNNLANEIILMGHSTGCQDILQYLMTNEAPTCISKIILQGCVSDRESPCAPHKMENLTGHLFVVAGWPCVFTKARFQSLFEKGGADDMFSSDLPDYPYIRNIKQACLVLYAQQDEYVPESVDKKKLLNKWTQLNKNLKCHLVPGTHFLPDKESFIQHCWPLIRNFISFT